MLALFATHGLLRNVSMHLYIPFLDEFSVPNAIAFCTSGDLLHGMSRNRNLSRQASRRKRTPEFTEFTR